MKDDRLHGQFNRWLARSTIKQVTSETILHGQYADARVRYIDGWIVIAVVAVKRRYQRRGVFTAFLVHCENTGRPLKVEWVENEDLRRFMERRSGYDKNDEHGPLFPSWTRS